MKRQTTTLGLSPAKLQRLFNVGKDVRGLDKRSGQNPDKAEMLHRRLSETLPLSESQIKMLQATLGPLCRTVSLIAGDTILSLLSDPATNRALIDRIKQHGKELSSRARSAAEYEVATAVYYAAIAHALVFHDLRITRFSYGRLRTAFSRLTQETWISKDLSMLFSIAAKRCAERQRH